MNSSTDEKLKEMYLLALQSNRDLYRAEPWLLDCINKGVVFNSSKNIILGAIFGTINLNQRFNQGMLNVIPVMVAYLESGFKVDALKVTSKEYSLGPFQLNLISHKKDWVGKKSLADRDILEYTWRSLSLLVHYFSQSDYTTFANTFLWGYVKYTHGDSGAVRAFGDNNPLARVQTSDWWTNLCSRFDLGRDASIESLVNKIRAEAVNAFKLL